MRIGPYEVTAPLGRGGMGAVYRARSPQGGEVAVKVIVDADAERLARFDRERRLLAQLGEKDGFVPLLDSGTAGASPYLVMPLLPGGSLRDRLEQGQLSIDETLVLARRLGSALARAHERGIVHRDLKPENVLFTARGEALIADLGLGKHVALPARKGTPNVTAPGEAKGTYGYMPPEQMNDSANAGPAADVFALGAILYECLAGKRAFAGETAAEIMVRVAAGTREPLASVRKNAPPSLVAVIDRALARSPADRFENGGAFVEALASGKTKGPSRRRAPIVLALFAGVGVAFVILVGRGPPLAIRIEAPQDGLETVESWLSVALATSGAVSAEVDPGSGVAVAVSLDVRGRGETQVALEGEGAIVVEARAHGARGGVASARVTVKKRAKTPAEVLAAKKKAATAGDVAAMLELASAFERSVPKDESEAATWYTRAAMAGDGGAMAAVARRLARGQGVEQNWTESARWYRKAAEKGEVAGMIGLGDALARGLGVTKDEAEAVLWYRKAGKDARGMGRLGHMLIRGLGTERAVGEGLALLREAADAGDPSALVELGDALFQGRFFAKNETEGVRCYRRAAEAGDPAGMAGLGNALRDGRGVAKNESEAAGWLRQAAEAGNAQGQYGLGWLYEHGAGGVPKDYDEALRWFRKSADGGDAEGTFWLGWMIVHGEGTTVDEAEAARLFRKAAEGGSMFGMYNLGLSLRDGHGVEKDEAEAIRWLQKAAAAGSRLAREDLEKLGVK